MLYAQGDKCEACRYKSRIVLPETAQLTGISQAAAAEAGADLARLGKTRGLARPLGPGGGPGPAIAKAIAKAPGPGDVCSQKRIAKADPTLKYTYEFDILDIESDRIYNEFHIPDVNDSIYNEIDIRVIKSDSIYNEFGIMDIKSDSIYNEIDIVDVKSDSIYHKFDILDVNIDSIYNELAIYFQRDLLATRYTSN